MAERVARVAIRQDDVFFVPAKNEGWRHGDLIKELARVGLPTPINGEQGFVTSTGRFVGRREAYYIAEEAEQFIRTPTVVDELFSEDVW